MTCDEFVIFLRACNPRDDGRDGWRVMLPDEVAAVEGGDTQGFDPQAHEQTVMLAVHRRHEGTKGGDKQRWRPVNQADVGKPQRGRDGGGKQPPTELAVKRVDLDNAQARTNTLLHHSLPTCHFLPTTYHLPLITYCPPPPGDDRYVAGTADGGRPGTYYGRLLSMAVLTVAIVTMAILTVAVLTIRWPR